DGAVDPPHAVSVDTPQIANTAAMGASCAQGMRIQDTSKASGRREPRKYVLERREMRVLGRNDDRHESLDACDRGPQFRSMENSALRSIRALRAPAVRWAFVLAATMTVAQLAACGERLPLAPSAKQVANLPLPAAPSYIIQFGNNGVVPQSLQAAVQQAGGHIARVQKSMGLALVTGLTPATANALRSSGAAPLMLPNVRRQYVREPVFASHGVLVYPKVSARTSRLTPLANADPRSAVFFDSLQWNMK